MDEILKPCPFCGGKANLAISLLGNYRASYRVECQKCLACISGHTELDCMNAWNKRAEPAMWFANYSMPGESMDELRAEVARLREALTRVGGYVEAYINGVEVGETGDKQYVYPSDIETYTGISDIVSSVLNPKEVE